MSIDVIDILGRYRCVNKGPPHGPYSTDSLRMRGCQMVGIAGSPVAEDLGVDLGSPLLGMFQLLQNDDSRSFGHYEAVPSHVKGAGSFIWFVVVLRAHRL